jgi:hypothetical protein
MPRLGCIVSVIAVVGVAAASSGCAGGGQVAVPPVDASAVTVAHTVLAAYRAGDDATLQALAEQISLHPGDLGHITDVHWLSPERETTRYPGFEPGDVYVEFLATTSGSPDDTIAASHDWRWGFVLARRSPHSRWLVVDNGV